MTIDEILQDSGLSQPPPTIGNDLLLWVREAQHVLDFFLFEETPMAAHDLERLRESAGALHADLTWYYEHATPWVRMGNGLATWREHMEIAYRRLRESVQARGFVDERKADRDFGAEPILLPVNLSRKATALAFTDAQGRLAVIDGNIGPCLGRPMAIGIRNYLVQQVLVEIVWCDERYSTYAEAMDDQHVRNAGGWPLIDPPRHVFVEAYLRSTGQSGGR